jgi:hypothetical protein
MRLGVGLAVLVILVGGLGFSGSGNLPSTRVAELWSCPREQTITLMPGELLSQAVNLKLFGPFAAGLTLEDAARLHGKPEGLFTSPHYAEWRYALYRTQDSFVEVAYEPTTSSCATYQRRTIYAYPLSGTWTPERVFQGALLSHLKLPQAATRLLVMEAGTRQDRAWFLVQNAGVKMINWYRMPEGTSETQ